MNESATPLLSAQEILSKLSRYVDGAPYPKAVVEAAIARREELTPLLLTTLEKVAADPGAIGDTEIGHVYALYLLAQFGEVRAYPLILKLVSGSSEAVEAALGDLVNEDLARILLSVFNGDIAPLKALAENDANDEYVRAAALETLVVLALHGKVERAEVVEYFRSLFNGKLSLEDESFVWTGLILACMDIHPGELMEEIRLAYKSGLIDGELITFGEVEDAAAEEVAASLASLVEDTQPITDTVASMSWWACFQPEGSGGSFGDFGDGDAQAAEGAEKPGVPVRAPEKIGRNEPCPCGSQKKYKKCCGKDA